MIGERRDERLTCSEQHLPGCYNPNSCDTYCICGDVRWSGEVGVWISHSVVEVEAGESPRPTSRIIGWDTYFLHATGCDRMHGSGLCAPSVPLALQRTGEVSA